MKTSIIFSLIILFSACTTPHIELTQDNLLQISINGTIFIKGKVKPSYKNNIKLLNLTINQTVFLMDDETVLVHEDASAGIGYRYGYGIRKTVAIVFPDYCHELIDIQGNLHFFVLNNKYKKEKTEYLILENINKKRIKIIYGLEKKLFNSLTKKSLSTIDKYTYIQSTEVFKDKSMYIKSNWDIKSSVLNSLVTQGGLGYFQ